MPTSPPLRKIAVIGGGISGLAAAHRLIELDDSLQVSLLEASNRLGGVLHTERCDEFLIEHSADMFTTREPWALELCRRIGFDEQLIPTNEEKRKAFVVRRGRLCEVPGGFTLMTPTRVWPILTTPLLSLRGKMRLGWERFVSAKRDEADESLASFATRRFGRQAYERIIQPLIGGIYTADPEQLSMQATMSQFVEMEHEYGSLIRAARKQSRANASEQNASGARYGLFVAPKDGMSSLVDAIAGSLPAGCVRCNAPVESLTGRDDGTWTLNVDGKSETFDAVVLAIPAPQSARLLHDADEMLADLMATISYASTSVVVTAYRRDQIDHPLNGFGFVVPLIENRNILASSFASVKFSGRAPDGCVLLRTFVGGACQPELAQLPDDELLQLVRSDLGELIGAAGEPVLARVARWNGAMPQYHVGHLSLVKRIGEQVSRLPNFELAGNAYAGVGIPFCVRSGEQAAERLLGRETQTNTESDSADVTRT